MFKLFLKLRQNGCKNLQNNIETRQVVYLNMIWLFSYLTICLNTILALFIYKSHFEFLIITNLVAQTFLWIVFILVYYGKARFAKYLFLLIIYLTISWHDHFYGKNALTNLYFFAFLPSAFNLFSLKRNPYSIVFFLLFPLFLILFAEMYGFKKFTINNWSSEITNQMRFVNIILGFLLFAIYSAYMILNSGLKQNKLIIQSVGLQTTLDNAVGGIWSIDTNYNILTVNKAFIEFAKVELRIADVKVDTNIREYVSSGRFPDYLKAHYSRVLNGEMIFETFTFKRKEYEIKATPIYHAKYNKIIGATFTCIDITSKVAAEKLLLEAKQKAEDASNTKERFLSNMSHELRTPLNGIVGITNIMLDEFYLPEQKQNFEILKNLSDHTLGVVNNILDISKIDADKALLSNDRFHFILFIKKLQSIFENTAKLKKIDFGIEINGDADIFLIGDEIKLSQVLINLIGNSIKFTERGFTKLIITIKETMVDTNMININFSVTDSGIGIHKKHQEKIFESFTQADENTTRKFGGTGLGITISEKILHLMDSKLYVESELGKGSNFWFDVSLKKSSFIPKNKIDLKNTSDYSLPNTKILLAEDNKINQIVAKRFLEKWKTTVTIVENGKEALNAALANKYDVILMDLDMPIMDGYEAATLIKEQNIQIPIIALTAASFENMHEYLLKKGFVDVVQKPFMPDDFYKKLSDILQVS
jgi:CheY-like chemotaxis protein